MKPEKIQLSEEERRTLQLNELQLLLEVYRICRKYKIRYSLDGGTLLGAARHQGFIPWDDDADVVFLRDDYEKFYTVCQRYLDHGRFFLQDYRTDAEYRWGYAKLRLKGTEFVRVGQEHMKYRTGVCIDIFVLDRVSDSNFVRRWDYFQLFCIRKALYSELGKVAADSWPLPGLLPSLLVKFRVVWRIESPLLAGVSPAPKQGPQNAVLTTAPAAIRSVIAPFFTRSMKTAWEDG